MRQIRNNLTNFKSTDKIILISTKSYKNKGFLLTSKW